MGEVDISVVGLAGGCDKTETETERLDIEEIEEIEVFRECERECDRPCEGLDRPNEGVLNGRPDPSLNDSNYTI